jgi:hypothetical protein
MYLFMVFFQHMIHQNAYVIRFIIKTLNWSEAGQIASDFDKNWCKLGFLFQEIPNMALPSQMSNNSICKKIRISRSSSSSSSKVILVVVVE